MPSHPTAEKWVLINTEFGGTQGKRAIFYAKGTEVVYLVAGSKQRPTTAQQRCEWKNIGYWE